MWPYNEEAGSHEHSFHLHVQVQRELDAKVVGISEDFLQQAAPLLADAANGLVTVFGLELDSIENNNVEETFLSILHCDVMVRRAGICLCIQMFR